VIAFLITALTAGPSRCGAVTARPRWSTNGRFPARRLDTSANPRHACFGGRNTLDFAKVLKTLDIGFEQRGLEWAVVGGVALVLHGLPRLTMDLDIMVNGDDQSKVLEFLDGLGYERLHVSQGYSNHLHPEPSWGRVDVLYVRGETREKVFGQAQTRLGPGDLAVPVGDPEHLIAMKVFACRSSPGRRAQDLADIRGLAEVAAVADQRVREIFARYDVLDLWETGR